jgi:hypothetical protein
MSLKQLLLLVLSACAVVEFAAAEALADSNPNFWDPNDDWSRPVSSRRKHFAHGGGSDAGTTKSSFEPLGIY